MTDSLLAAFPRLATRLGKMRLAELPTPVGSAQFESVSGERTISIKRDDMSNLSYGGNKIRKLDYILQRAREREAKRIATFGAVGSNHALATAILAVASGFDCTCLLAPQKSTPMIARTLNMHRRIGTELIPLGRSNDRLATYRRSLQHRRCWVVPMGGSSWLGAVGFVNAGLELAQQIASGEIPMPARIYMANGTMGSCVGLSLGLALAELPIELHAVRVVDERFASPPAFQRLQQKTATMLRRLDPSIPADLAARSRLRWRDEFFAGGYAVSDAVTRSAVDRAATLLDLRIETTYTGKAMAALLHDLESPRYDGGHYLFWNTYNSQPLPVTGARPSTRDNIPEEFMRYFD